MVQSQLFQTTWDWNIDTHILRGKINYLSALLLMGMLENEDKINELYYFHTLITVNFNSTTSIK